jgi:hypothetical protein
VEWNNENIQRLTSAFMAGKPYKEIGETLGCTRQAISGKVHRLGLMKDEALFKTRMANGGASNHCNAVRGWANRRVQLGLFVPPRKRKFPEKPRPINMELPLEQEFLGLTLFQLPKDGCHYPKGDGPFLFCGQKAREDSTYCAYHHAMCRVPAKRRR